MPDDAAYSIALSQVPGVGPAMFRALCARFGSPAGVFRARAAQLERVRGLGGAAFETLRRGDALLRSARRILADIRSSGFEAVTADSAGYPARLRDLSDAPPVLYVRGRLPGANDKTFSVAGSSSPSARGGQLARVLGGELARARRTLVSGYAYGVDAAAHLGALESGGRTVLVLPMGVSAFSLRPEFRRFSGNVGRELILMSECAPDDGWSARNAVRRDRLIAALGDGLLVVECRPQSGTMITFGHALRLGRPAYVVRYRRPPPGADGNAAAIRRGGIAVASLAAFRRILSAPRLPSAAPRVRQAELF